MKIYAYSGINWEFLFSVEYEDDDIIVLKDMGRYHRFDEDQMFKGTIDKYIDIFRQSEQARIDGKLKLMEIKSA